MNTSTMPEIEQSSHAGLLEEDHLAGNRHAALLLLEYGDYECPACFQAERMTRHLLEVFGRRMRFVFRHFPLVDAHPHAQMAAEAAEAAGAQGRFWPMHHALFAHSSHLTREAITRCADSIGLDMLRFNAELADRFHAPRVWEDLRSRQAAQLHGSPTFFLDGAIIDVSFGFDRLESAVRAALAEKR